jgi:CBS domain-containing protein
MSTNTVSKAPIATTPASSLLSNFRQELSPHAPFSQMSVTDIDYFLSHATQTYFAPDETLIDAEDGVPAYLYYIRQGAVTGVRSMTERAGGAFEYVVGDIFPIGAALAGRPVTATYRSSADTFVLLLPVADMHALAQRSLAFAQFLTTRTAKFLELSRKALRAEFSDNLMAEQSLERPLSEVIQFEPVKCAPNTPLREVLEVMSKKRIGSMLVTSPAGEPVGILTRSNIIARITLPQLSLDSSISDVMTQPVRTLSVTHTAQDAALLMSRYGIRHIPVTKDSIAIGLVSEHDLFAIHKQSLKSVSSAIRAANDTDALKSSAKDIRQLARVLLGQGLKARQLTELISHLNDVLTERIITIKGDEHKIDLSSLCWIALGSEGRGEQTIATDQDNALILPNGTSAEMREKIRAFAHEVNLALDAYGYPLCRGGIMAGEAACCLTLDEWKLRFIHWIAHGSPEDLLNASIYFDFRPLLGDTSLADDLRQVVVTEAKKTPRFIKQMALNALTRQVPLNWRGAVDTDSNGMIDLKLQAAAIVVDAARIYALGYGIEETNTCKRLTEVGILMKLADTEYDAWVSGFDFLQMLRLRVQVEDEINSQSHNKSPNSIKVAELNDIDRRILRETFRVVRHLQQRMQLDYQR